MGVDRVRGWNKIIGGFRRKYLQHELYNVLPDLFLSYSYVYAQVLRKESATLPKLDLI